MFRDGNSGRLGGAFSRLVVANDNNMLPLTLSYIPIIKGESRIIVLDRSLTFNLRYRAILFNVRE